jgi:hypothetical protein
MASHAPTQDGSNLRRSASKARSSASAWTEERKEILRRMWKSHRTSGDISKRLGGVSRNAVMGMVNRLGLLGRGGSKENHATLAEAKRLLQDTLQEPYCRDNPHHVQTLVAIGAAMGGRDASALSKLLHVDEDKVAHALSSFHESGVWVEGEAMPKSWEEPRTGNVSLAMDSLVAIGTITRVRTDSGEWEYRAIRD